MQVYKLISFPKSAVWRQLNSFRKSIEKKEVWRPIDDVDFVFLCGANIGPNSPSKRRESLLEFSYKSLPYAKFFLAESIFQVLEKEGHKDNLLDIENELSAFSDYIIVILESESSFCELGAFANNKELRDKLIIVNDLNHKGSQSFINLGPVKAVSEISKNKNVLYYKMDDEGKFRGDGIGAIFKDLHDLIHKKPKVRRTRVEGYNPNDNFTKDSLRFIHDLIYLSNPITFTEISRIIKVLFSSSKEDQLQKALGLLCATKQVRRSADGYYNSLHKQPFFEYDLYDVTCLMASFKNMYFRHDRERLYESP